MKYLWGDILSNHPTTQCIFSQDNFFDIKRQSTFKKLNWKPIFSLDECINFTISWYLAHKKKRDMFQFTKEQILKYQKKIKI